MQIFWFRQDLRLADNPGLSAALNEGEPVLLLYILDDGVPADRLPGGASRWWLHHSLAALAADVAAADGTLVLRRGDPAEILTGLVSDCDITGVHWSRCYEPHAIARDKALTRRLTDLDVAVHTYNGSLLYEPWEIETMAGGPYKVFSQFWKRGRVRSGVQLPELQDAPATLAQAANSMRGDRLTEWGLLPVDPDWATGLEPAWQPGELGAAQRLEEFVHDGINGYKVLRNRPDREKVSRLSPHLHWGEIAPWRAWHATAAASAMSAGQAQDDIDCFHTELGWREFSYHLLYHFPNLPDRNWRPAFDNFAWRTDAVLLRAWQRGRTGYPFVDAGMRELWATGWMHNRVRMVVASFLIKHCLIHWSEGERWFWDTLVDADLANNSASWQWVAGSGADAAPFFRIFNPIVQGERFDPEGIYTRRWVPELNGLPKKYLHRPWEADAGLLEQAGIRLGRDYPLPIVDHAEARERALAAFKALKHLPPPA